MNEKEAKANPLGASPKPLAIDPLPVQGLRTNDACIDDGSQPPNPNNKCDKDVPFE
jgi:hypothetical protein